MHHSQYLLSQAFDFFFYNIFYAFFYVFLRSNGMVFSGMDYESKCPRFKTIRWLCVWLNLSSYFCIVQYLQYQCCKYKYHFWCLLTQNICRQQCTNKKVDWRTAVISTNLLYFPVGVALLVCLVVSVSLFSMCFPKTLYLLVSFCIIVTL